MLETKRVQFFDYIYRKYRAYRVYPVGLWIVDLEVSK